MTGLTEFWRDEEAQDMVEYSLLMTFIALSVVGLLAAVNADLFGLWTSISGQVSNVVVTQTGS